MTEKLAITLQDDACVILLNGEITEEQSLMLHSAFEKCVYYQYERVTLSINSPGGNIHAMRHMLAGIEQWRKKGKVVHTIGNFRVASAAALLLTFGEIGGRTVHQYSSVLYHLVRFGGGSALITAGAASTMANVLKTYDMGLLNLVTEHLVHGYGGIDRMHTAGLARCGLLRDQWEVVALGLGEPVKAKQQPWLKKAQAMFESGMKSQSTSAFVRYLEKRSELDTPMDLREGWVLGLYDRVMGVDALPPYQPQRRLPEQSHAPKTGRRQQMTFGHVHP